MKNDNLSHVEPAYIQILTELGLDTKTITVDEAEKIIKDNIEHLICEALRLYYDTVLSFWVDLAEYKTFIENQLVKANYPIEDFDFNFINKSNETILEIHHFYLSENGIILSTRAIADQLYCNFNHTK